MANQQSTIKEDAEFLVTGGLPDGGDSSDDIWNSLEVLSLYGQSIKRNRLISAQRNNSAYQTIDMLRTKLLQALDEHGWKKVAITSATPGCGKTFVAANLALSIARGGIRKVVLMDMNLRAPGLARFLDNQIPKEWGITFRVMCRPKNFLQKLAIISHLV